MLVQCPVSFCSVRHLSTESLCSLYFSNTLCVRDGSWGRSTLRSRLCAEGHSSLHYYAKLVNNSELPMCFVWASTISPCLVAWLLWWRTSAFELSFFQFPPVVLLATVLNLFGKTPVMSIVVESAAVEQLNPTTSYTHIPHVHGGFWGNWGLTKNS